VRRVLAAALGIGIALSGSPATAARVPAPAHAPATARKAVIPDHTPAKARKAVIPDLRLAGTYPVNTSIYDLGDTALTVPQFPGKIEVRGIVHAPVQAKGGSFPLVILVHGRHSTCASPDGPTLHWPCPAGQKPIQSYRGYDYLASNLASHGFVVVSISANGVNAVDNDVTDFGADARSALIEKHLALWKQWNTTGGAPFGDAFTGAVNPAKLGLMGHSRGGEGVARFAAKKPVTGFTLGAVLPLAPTDFGRQIVTDVPLAVALPLCDGDVSDLQGIHYIDDGRYAKAGDTGSKLTVTVAGGNHNFFNTIWSPSSGETGAGDDAGWTEPGSVCETGAPGRLTETQQRVAGLAYVNGFFRFYLGGEQAMKPLWTGEARAPAWVGANVQVSRHPADRAAQRRVVNRLELAADLKTNALGGAVVTSGLVKPGLCATFSSATSTVCLAMSRPSASRSEPHVAYFDGRTLPIFKASWTATGATLTNDVPAAQGDLGAFAAVQLRVAVDFSDARNKLGTAQGLSFGLTDAAGHRVLVAASPYTRALDFPPLARASVAGDSAPHFLLQQVRVPLSAFVGVDLTTVRKITVVFDGQASGSLGLSDLLITG
jgi:dienelactone hydrolase